MSGAASALRRRSARGKAIAFDRGDRALPAAAAVTLNNPTPAYRSSNGRLADRDATT